MRGNFRFREMNSTGVVKGERSEQTALYGWTALLSDRRFRHAPDQAIQLVQIVQAFDSSFTDDSN